MAAKARRKPRARTGKVGAQIFEQIESLVTDQKMKRTAAFQKLAEKTGRNPGTVAANYYRVARQRGAHLRPRRSALGPAVGAVSARGVQRQLARALDAIRDLGTLIQKQAVELDRLRRRTSRFDEIRRLVGRT